MERTIEICIVDDEAIVCERLAAMLERSGFAVETFTDSGAALKQLARKDFDILITDVKMSGPDGLELLQYMTSHSPATRVVVITGFATVDTARKAMKGGAVDFIAKPFRMSMLFDLISKIADEIRGSAGETELNQDPNE